MAQVMLHGVPPIDPAKISPDKDRRDQRGRQAQLGSKQKIIIPILYSPSPNLIADLGEGQEGGQ